MRPVDPTRPSSPPALPLPAGSARARARAWAWAGGRRGLSLCLALLSLLLMAVGSARAQDPLMLRDSAAAYDAWEAARVLFDPEGRLAVREAMAKAEEFAPAGPLRANLGKRAGAVWVLVPLSVPAAESGRWVLDIDYASLDLIDAYLLDGDRIERHVRMGDHVDRYERPMLSRSHAVHLDLPAGSHRSLLIRVQTTGSMIVPIRLSTPAEYQRAEASEQALQGLFAGAGLCLLLYTLSQWVSLRDPMFGWYALTLLGTTAFFGALSGMGPQHLWGHHEWLVRHAPPFAILLGVCGAFFFVLHALEVATIRPRIAIVVRICGAIAGLTALMFALGWLDYATTQTVGMALGPAPLLLVLPTAFQRLREGDRAARWVLLGWGVYSLGVLVIVSLLRGWLPVGFWTLHAFQFASLIEMGTWMLVLGERVRAIRLDAELTQLEHGRLHSMAHTDALTGLLNRRGLSEALQARLAKNNPGQAIAVFLIDLDGFKPINDSFGHEAGDAVLTGVAKRLRDAVRAADLVCRLGGDEFVVVVGLRADNAEADAEVVGAKLLQAMEQPFTVGSQLCRVGLTAGYALAPQDDSTLDGLLKRADAAMYAGKQAGRHCVRRGGASAVLAGN